MKFKITCPLCSKDSIVEASKSGVDAWFEGASAERVIPELSADDRETLISGLCKKCSDDFYEIPEKIKK